MIRSLEICIVLFVVPTDVLLYKLRCPKPSEWYFRSQSNCKENPEIYFCLYNTLTESYVDGCSKYDYDRPGNKVVIAGKHTTRKPCAINSYQPFKFRPNRISDCSLQKSLCSEEGQMLFEESTRRKDRMCKCDYRKSYIFVTKPKNFCYCIPSEEDCSCIIKHCDVNFTLSPDYTCIHQAEFFNRTVNNLCSPIQHRTDEVTELYISNSTNYTETITRLYKSSERSFQIVAVIISIAISTTLIILLATKGKWIDNLSCMVACRKCLSAPLITEDECNYLKIVHLLHRVALISVRVKFDQKINPSDLETVLIKHYKSLLTLKNKMRITQQDWLLLFPRKGDHPKSTEFDLGLLMILIRNLTDLKIGKQLPLATEKSNSADLTRINQYRKIILKRCPGTLSAKDFTLYWDDISRAVIRLAGNQLLEPKMTEDMQLNRLKDCLYALTPVRIEDDRFIKLIILSYKYAAHIIMKIIQQFYATVECENLMEFLDKEKHHMFHKRKKTFKCCSCENKTFDKSIMEYDWNRFFREINNGKHSHEGKDLDKRCPEYFSAKELDEHNIHVSLGCYLIANIDDLYSSALEKLKNVDSHSWHNIFICRHGCRGETSIDPFYALKVMRNKLVKDILNGNLSERQFNRIWAQMSSGLFACLQCINEEDFTRKMKTEIKGLRTKNINKTEWNEFLNNLPEWILDDINLEERSDELTIFLKILSNDVKSSSQGCRLRKLTDRKHLMKSCRYISDVTKQETYYLRVVHLLLAVASKAVRKQFDRTFKPSKLKQTLNHQKQIVLELKKDKLLSDSQWNLLYSPVGELTSADLDFDLLIFLLKHLENINIPENIPPKKSINQGSDLARIVTCRRRLMKKKDGVLTETEFKKYWDDVSTAITRIGGKDFERICYRLKNEENLLDNYLNV